MHFAQISLASHVICMTLIRFPQPHVSSYFVLALGLQSVLLYLLWWSAAVLGGLLCDPRATW